MNKQERVDQQLALGMTYALCLADVIIHAREFVKMARAMEAEMARPKLDQVDVKRRIIAIKVYVKAITDANNSGDIPELILATRELEILVYQLRESLPGGENHPDTIARKEVSMSG